MLRSILNLKIRRRTCTSSRICSHNGTLKKARKVVSEDSVNTMEAEEPTIPEKGTRMSIFLAVYYSFTVSMIVLKTMIIYFLLK